MSKRKPTKQELQAEALIARHKQNVNPADTEGVFTGGGILGSGNPANITMKTDPTGSHIPLVGAQMDEQARSKIMQWAKGAKNIPYGGSMIGITGDAGKEIAEARQRAGPNPMEEYVPRAYKEEHPEWAGKQEARFQEYQQRVGKELGDITGMEGGYDPAAGDKYWREITNRGMSDQALANRQEWLRWQEMIKRLREK